MRMLMLACALALLPGATRAQITDTARIAPDTAALPRAVAEYVALRYNADVALRARGAATVAAGEVVDGDVAVLRGPLTVRGRIGGNVVVVNGDAVVGEGAEIEGDLVIVGGVLARDSSARIGGIVRVYTSPMSFHEEGGRIVVDADRTPDDWWSRIFRRDAESWRPRLLSARTYNRVEGLPVLLGPSLRHETSTVTVEVDAFGIVRTADGFDWDGDDIGHTLRADVRIGGGLGPILGASLYDVVEPVQDWELTDAEAGLATFFLHRDYRDFYDRHGASGSIGVHAGRDVTLRLEYGAERWGSRDVSDPWTLFRNGAAWRPNPAVDDGFVHLAAATLEIDTRNDVENPWSGWYVTADFESGRGDFRSFGATDPLSRAASAAGSVRWRRGFLDLRRYNRLSPEGQLNLRLVAGGWLGGGELPLQRRFSLGGPGSLPGFDFRSGEDAERLQCASDATVPGAPGQCERVLLAQIEYRGDVEMGPFFGERGPASWGLQTDAFWILFADVGRGWLVGPRAGSLAYPSDRLPSLSTFQTDIGAGLDLGILALYAAKSLSDADEPVNFFVRVRHRF
ncbi:MAG TPA: BamA/TamA family outer membrane protein [Gemmatimonadaceae bacterium]